jgi:polyisoprenoid-binding protein YceI
MATWYIDPSHSAVTFGVKHMMVSTVRGKFGTLSGTLQYDPERPAETSISAAIDAGTIDTNDARRDGHLKSADFFDVASHPVITFKSTGVEPKAKSRFIVKGDLTIRGTTKPVRFEAELEGISVDGKGGSHLGATGTLAIDRRQWGLEWNQPIANGVLVGDTVKIELGLEAIDESVARQMGLIPAAAA